MPDYDARTALLVVDVQNDFADPAGSLAVPDGAAVVPPINAEIEAAQAAGAFVICTQDWHPEHTPHFDTDGGVWPPHCVHDSWGAALHPGLNAVAESVRKGQGGEDGYSAFSVRDAGGALSDTPLDALLNAKGVQQVVIVGLATDYCVRETALDAVRRGFHTTVLRNAVRAVDLEPGDGDRALEVLEAAGVSLQ